MKSNVERKLSKAIRKTTRVICEKMPSGGIIVNGLSIEKYFNEERLLFQSLKALKLSGLELSLRLFVYGGGKSAQSSACCTAIARTILLFFPDMKILLSKFLRTDDRMKEREKVGLMKSRKDHPYHRR